jgi:hypothetical protein
VGKTALDVLSYNVNATNDAIYWLGGNPYGNRYRWYSGSANDFLLNLRVQRFDAILEWIGRYLSPGEN